MTEKSTNQILKKPDSCMKASSDKSKPKKPEKKEK